MKMAASMLQNMDSSFIANMMKQNTGMDMSAEQIESMKKMMTPEMMESIRNMDPSVVIFQLAVTSFLN